MKLSPKEHSLIRGAIRRVFSRSDLRRAVIEEALITHSDPTRPRVKRWGRCKLCLKPTPKSYLEVDHINPVIKTTETALTVPLEIFIQRLWCEQKNLQALCSPCHKTKSLCENRERRINKKVKRKRRASGKSSKKD